MTETDNSRLHNGRFAPGNPGKQKGTSKNKMRDEIRKFISDQWESFPDWFSSLNPKEKVDTMLALLPYSVSRLQSISMTDSEGEDLEKPLQIEWSKLKPETLKDVLNNSNHED